MPDLSAVSTLGSAPVPGANPAGASARYEAEFEKLSAEIAKLESPGGRAGIKWGDVFELSTGILTSKSKDLLVAGYLTLGGLQKHGYAGLRAGLQVCKDMLATHWDALFPEKARLRARASALQWMGERVSAAVTERPGPGKPDREALEASAALLKEIDSFCAEKFPDGGPDLNELIRAVRDKVDALPSDAPAPESSGSSGSSGAVATGPAVIDTPEAAKAALDAVREPRLKAAEVLRKAAPSDPLPYLLQRTALWEDIVEAPASKEGQTEIAGGDAAFAAQAEELLGKGDWAALLQEAESRLPANPVWFDLDLWVYRALEGLGKPYANARKAVAEETGALLRRVPGLLDLKFADGTPMASQAVKLWLSHEVGGGGPGGGKAGAPAADGPEAVMAEARGLVARKDFPGAAQRVLKEVQKATRGRDRFVWRLNLAKLCLEAGKPEQALPQLQSLDEEGRKFGLEDWEPGLAAELVRELWKCYKGSASADRAEECYARLCRLDPAAALGVDPMR